MRIDSEGTLQPGEEKVGLRVVYSPAHHNKREEDKHGYITNWIGGVIFVRFDGDEESKGCRRCDLYISDGALD